MRQLILLNLVGSLLLSTHVEAMNYRGGHHFDEYGVTVQSKHGSFVRLLEEGEGVQSQEVRLRNSTIKHYASPADFYINNPASGFASHVKLIYSGDVKLKDFIRLAPLWETVAVLGLPSLLAMILFSHFIF